MKMNLLYNSERFFRRNLEWHAFMEIWLKLPVMWQAIYGQVQLHFVLFQRFLASCMQYRTTDSWPWEIQNCMINTSPNANEFGRMALNFGAVVPDIEVVCSLKKLRTSYWKYKKTFTYYQVTSLDYDVYPRFCRPTSYRNETAWLLNRSLAYWYELKHKWHGTPPKARKSGLESVEQRYIKENTTAMQNQPEIVWLPSEFIFSGSATLQVISSYQHLSNSYEYIQHDSGSSRHVCRERQTANVTMMQ